MQRQPLLGNEFQQELSHDCKDQLEAVRSRLAELRVLLGEEQTEDEKKRKKSPKPRRQATSSSQASSGLSQPQVYSPAPAVAGLVDATDNTPIAPRVTPRLSPSHLL